MTLRRWRQRGAVTAYTRRQSRAPCMVAAERWAACRPEQVAVRRRPRSPAWRRAGDVSKSWLVTKSGRWPVVSARWSGAPEAGSRVAHASHGDTAAVQCNAMATRGQRWYGGPCMAFGLDSIGSPLSMTATHFLAVLCACAGLIKSLMKSWIMAPSMGMGACEHPGPTTAAIIWCSSIATCARS